MLSKFFAVSESSYFENFDLDTISTQIKPDVLDQLLRESEYDRHERDFIVEGFRNGFDLGYQGPEIRQSESRNIPFNIGNKFILWEKIMKEVKLGRVAGPFELPPFPNFIQSPIGLVPKAGNQTRLIFHLSYNFSGNLELDGSVNHFTPKDLCRVKYRDLDYAVQTCLKFRNKAIFLAKSDLKSAFRLVPLKKSSYPWVLFKAEDPRTGRMVFFVDKVLPFGASISCALFSKLSNCLQHILEFQTGKKFQVTNYLDDFLFIEDSAQGCNHLVRSFLHLCEQTGVAVAFEKTEWASNSIIFLGILIDGLRHVLAIPEDKKKKALFALHLMQSKRTATVEQMESLSGLLNFLNKAIHPGRAFTRRMYAKFNEKVAQMGKKLRKYHHITLDAEFKMDCAVWSFFLNNQWAVCRPIIDLRKSIDAVRLNFYTDASRAENLGFGCRFGNLWTCSRWEKGYIEKFQPSIQYLELYALCVGILTWERLLNNVRLVVFCDNLSVCNMINNITSGCKHCMVLVRILTINNLVHSRRVFAEHVASKKNVLADSLSRFDWKRFWDHAPESMNAFPSPLPDKLWPASKVWKDFR